jgi:hypothetical protein
MVGFGGYENDLVESEEVEKKKPVVKKKVPSKPLAPRPEWVDTHEDQSYSEKKVDKIDELDY